MQKEQGERDNLFSPFDQKRETSNLMRMVEILCPEDMGNDILRYCREEDAIVKHCYGYYRKNCPQTCTYAKRMNNKNGK